MRLPGDSMSQGEEHWGCPAREEVWGGSWGKTVQWGHCLMSGTGHHRIPECSGCKDRTAWGMGWGGGTTSGVLATTLALGRAVHIE